MRCNDDENCCEVRKLKENNKSLSISLRLPRWPHFHFHCVGNSRTLEDGNCLSAVEKCTTTREFHRWSSLVSNCATCSQRFDLFLVPLAGSMTTFGTSREVLKYDNLHRIILQYFEVSICRKVSILMGWKCRKLWSVFPGNYGFTSYMPHLWIFPAAHDMMCELWRTLKILKNSVLLAFLRLNFKFSWEKSLVKINGIFNFQIPT